MLALSQPQAAISQLPKKPISVDQAKKLVLAALTLKTRSLPGFGLELEHDSGPEYADYYNFMGDWDGAEGGSAMLGFYAVDPETGDVFSGTVGCYEISTTALRKLQKEFRYQIGLSAETYKKIKKKGPLCQ